MSASETKTNGCVRRKRMPLRWLHILADIAPVAAAVRALVVQDARNGAAARDSAHRWALNPSQPPSRHQQRKQSQTACQGGESFGKSRHGQIFSRVLTLLFSMYVMQNNQTAIAADMSASMSQGYHVGGYIEVHELRMPRDAVSERKWKLNQRTEFETHAGGCFWRVVASYGPEHYSVYAGDGTNIYSYLVQEQTIRDKGFSAYPATVVPGQIPVDSTWYIVIPWLSFASQPFLDAQADLQDVKLPAPWTVPLSDPLALAFKCAVKRGKEPPYLPQSAKFYPDEAVIKRVAGGENLSLGGQNISERDKSRLRASRILKTMSGMAVAEGEFEVKDWIKVDSLQIPSEIILTRFIVVKGVEQPENRDLMTRFRLVVTNAMVKPALGTLPQPDRKLSVADYRLQNRELGIRQLLYAQDESGGWRHTNDPVLAALFESAVGKAKSRVYFSRSSIAFGLAILLMVPLVWWFRRRKTASLA